MCLAWVVKWDRIFSAVLGYNEPGEIPDLPGLPSAEQVSRHWWILSSEPSMGQWGGEKSTSYIQFTPKHFVSLFLCISLLTLFQNFSALSVWFSKSHLRLLVAQPNNCHYFQLLRSHWIQNSGTHINSAQSKIMFSLSAQPSTDILSRFFLIWTRKLLQFFWWVSHILLVLTL